MVLIGAAFVVIEIGLRGAPDALVGTATTQSAALAALALFAVRSSAAGSRPRIEDSVALATLLLTGVVIAAGWFGMFLALQLGSVVTVLPLVSTYPLVVVVLSYLLAGERPRSMRVVAAVAVIVVGAGLVQAG
jgi:drug/metabolite transporter (DMT)-like permease